MTSFGFERRICPGRYFAMDTLWLSVASILPVFTIGKLVDESGRKVDIALRYKAGLNRPQCKYRHSMGRTTCRWIWECGIGQPVATIFYNSFGRHGTLSLWSFITLVHSPPLLVKFLPSHEMVRVANTSIIGVMFVKSQTCFFETGALPLARSCIALTNIPIHLSTACGPLRFPPDY
ncbi:hypothetical protein BDN71DRAFT_1290469 [Pleurotus eryngii]|uniref:Cytochrome P450 n=1 Tax=Pleurotus eryngii TaxID=5323 RepID=A0A9P5ZQP1_PLEER|nr:hypothetical protein BDN71DRAFT_1290469 [Pleurotus eryngii]